MKVPQNFFRPYSSCSIFKPCFLALWAMQQVSPIHALLVLPKENTIVGTRMNVREIQTKVSCKFFQLVHVSREMIILGQ